MENATDALIMAGSVLLLIIALTVSISSLSNLKTQTQDILTARDQLQDTTDSSGYLNYIKNDDKGVRIVGIETIISSLRRMKKEGYTMYIATNDTLTELPQDLKIDSNKVQASDIIQGKNIIKLSMSGTGNKYIEDEDVIKTIYSYEKSKKFKEYIGIYQNAANGVADVNKTKYKIITFVEE